MPKRHVRSSVATRVCAIVATLAGVTIAAPALANDPTGEWQVEDGVAVIRIQQCGGNMWGAVVWEKKPGGTDKNNPDKSIRSRPTLGMATLIDMKKNPKGKDWAGQVYNSNDGKLYNSTIELKTPNELEIEGCVMKVLCGGQTWTRVGPPIPVTEAVDPAKTPATKGTGATKTAAPAAPAVSPAPKATQPGNAKAAQPGNAKAATNTKSAAAQAEDPVGNICLLPEIAARLPH